MNWVSRRNKRGVASSHRGNSVWLAIATVGLMAGHGPEAHAGPGRSEVDRDAARGMVQRGDALRRIGKHKSALKAYREADRIMKVPTTAIEVGRMAEKTRAWVEAVAAYRRAMRYPRRPAEPRPFTRARAAAKKLLAALEPRLPRLSFKATGLKPGVKPRFSLDGKRPKRSRALPVDPVEHTLTVRAPGYQKQQRKFTIQPNQERSFVFSMKEEEKEVRVVKVATGRSWWPWVYTSYGISAAGFVAGGVLGMLSINDAQELADNCLDGVCPAVQGYDVVQNRSLALAHASTATFVIGAVGAVVGTYALVVQLRQPKAAKAGADSASRNKSSWQLGVGLGQLRLGRTF